MIKISVIIPVFNCEQYINQCIQSVLCQTLKELEIICIDDGSTDYSVRVIQSVQEDDRRILLYKQKNKGAGAARNLAIEKARGKYVAFLDADDYYVDVNALDIMFHTCEIKKLAACGSLRMRCREGIEETETLFQGIPTDAILHYQDFQLDYNYQSFLFKRDLLVKNDIFFPNYRRFQDPPFLVRALHKAVKFSVADTYLYCYRVSDMSFRFNSQKVIDLLHGLMDNLQFAKKHNLKILFYNTVQRIEDEYVDIICKNISLENLEILKLLLDVNEVISEFYGKVSYVIQPIRVLSFAIVQYPYREDLLCRIENQDEIALYGAGKYGTLFFYFLKQNCLQNKVKCFIVSKHIGNKSQIEGVPVITLEEFMQKREKRVFVVVRRNSRKEISQTLDKYKFEDYEIVKEEFLHVIATEDR